MSSVKVEISWSGGSPTASPDPVPVDTKKGQDQVHWHSTEDFIITLETVPPVVINANGSGSNYVANSGKFTTPGKIPYTIASASGGPAVDPEIDVQG
jgi:hypothetical protein